MSSASKEEERVRPPPKRDQVWKHFLVLLFSATLVGFLQGLSRPQATVLSSLATLHESLFAILPIVTGVAVGMSLQVSFRRAVAVVLVSTAIMAGLDVLPPSGQGPQSVSTFLRGGQEVALATPGNGDWRAAGSIAVSLRVAAGQFPEASERLNRYPLNHPRITASAATIKVAFLIMPFVVAGIILGIGTWLGRRVIFRAHRDEVLGLTALAWGLSPVMVYLSVAASARAQTGILFRDAGLGMIFVPYIPALVLAVIGWRALRRGRRS